MSDHKSTNPSHSYLMALKRISPFSSLPEQMLELLAARVDHHVFPANSFIFHDGESSKDQLFIIISGLAEISVKNSKGESLVLDYRSVDSFFGETVILSKKSYVATVKAVTALECLIIKSQDIEFLIENNGVFAIQFSQMVADHFYALINKIPMDEGVMHSIVTQENQGAQKRASELMNSPVVTANPDDTIAALAQQMSDNHVSSIVITDQNNHVIGSITEKDLVTNVLAKKLSSDQHRASEIVSKEPLLIEPDAYYYQVLLAMTKAKVKHAIVVEQSQPIGIITVRDLIRTRSSGVISVIDRLETQSNLKDLAQVGLEIEQVLNGLMIERAPIPEILDIITEFYDRLTRRVIDLAVADLTAKLGPPPVKFCWLTMGSSGRREQFLRTDQDNAIIYETVLDPEEAKKVDSYFKQLSELINDGLITCGFEHCPGNVMARYPNWRGNTAEWNKKVSNWVNILDSENIRLLTIFLDFRPVYGYEALADELRTFTNNNFKSLPLALSFLAHDATLGKLPVNMFGNLVGVNIEGERNVLDLKTTLSVFLIDCVRLLAINQQATATNTLERIRFLQDQGALSGQLAGVLTQAFNTIMRIRIGANLTKQKEGKSPDNYLALARLTQLEKLELRDATKALETLIAIVREDFIHVK